MCVQACACVYKFRINYSKLQRIFKIIINLYEHIDIQLFNSCLTAILGS